MSIRYFWAHVTGPRAADLERIFGTSTVPVRSPTPHVGVPGLGRREVYLLDLDWVKEQSRWDDLIAFLSDRFGREPADVERSLDAEGMPLLAIDTVIRIDHSQRWLDDEDE